MLHFVKSLTLNIRHFVKYVWALQKNKQKKTLAWILQIETDPMIFNSWVLNRKDT